MIKKVAVFLLLALLSITLFACAREEATQVDAQVNAENGVDIDLTAMSSSMIYAQVYDFLSDPQAYDGKVIKLVGTLQSQYYEVTDTTYNFVIINDATGCCPQGLEFFDTSENELPEQGTQITVIGSFEPYDENGNKYYRIVTDEVTVL